MSSRGESCRPCQGSTRTNARTTSLPLNPFVPQGFSEYSSKGYTSWELSGKKLLCDSEDTSHRTRVSKCRTLSTSIFGHALFCDTFMYRIHSRTRDYPIKNCSTSLFVKIFVNAPIDILNTQSVGENQIKDCREHAHTSYLDCHGRTNFHKNRNFCGW